MRGYKKVLLNNTGHYVLVDRDDYDRICKMGSWYESSTGYAVKRVKINGKNVTIRMHRFLMDPPEGLQVDHINGDRLDNRKSNLRCVGAEINQWNRVNNRGHTKYDLPKHITYDGSRGKFVATKIIRKRFDSLKDAIKFQQESEVLDYVRN